MKISLEWLSDYVRLPAHDPARLAHDLTLTTVEVDGYERIDDDVVLEIDNKSLTNRPDLWGHYGIAREFAVRYGLPLAPLPRHPRPPAVTGLVSTTDPAEHRRLTAVECTADRSRPAPGYVRTRLRRIGVPSRDLCTDLSAYVMYATGQPSDVRASPGSVVLTVPTLVAARARAAARTEASVRQEKGLDTQRVDQAVDLFLRLLSQADPAAVALGEQDVVLSPTHGAEIDLSLSLIERRLGVRLPGNEILAILRGLGFTAEITDDVLRATAPSWRSTGDISSAADVIEELARLHGYDNLPAHSPVVTLNPDRSRLPVSRRVREALAARGGIAEVLTYPWSADRLLAACGLTAEAALDRPPAPDRSRLRPALLPNLLEAAAANLRYYDEFSLFEVGAVYPSGTSLGVMLAGPDGIELFRRAKGLLDLLRRHCHLSSWELSTVDGPQWADPSARLAIHADGRPAGAVALVRPAVRRAAGIDRTQLAGIELDLGALRPYASRENRYEPVSDLPEPDFDLSVVLADTVPWCQVADTATRAHPLVRRVTYVGEYRGAAIPPDHRSLTARITLRPTVATLTAAEIADARAAVFTAIAAQTGAQLR